jgi:hypothetical protein
MYSQGAESVDWRGCPWWSLDGVLREGHVEFGRVYIRLEWIQ